MGDLDSLEKVDHALAILAEHDIRPEGLAFLRNRVAELEAVIGRLKGTAEFPMTRRLLEAEQHLAAELTQAREALKTARVVWELSKVDLMKPWADLELWRDASIDLTNAMVRMDDMFDALASEEKSDE